MKRRIAYPSLPAFVEATGIPQQDLAKKAGIVPSHLSMILKGERTPSLPLALKLAKIANIPVESLVGKLHEADVA